jgi:drug/metabolite transporter (DMT)-like permease
MCAGLFIASGSFFIGQQQVMPKFVQGSPALIVLGVAPIFLMIFWLFGVRLTKAFKTEPMAA